MNTPSCSTVNRSETQPAEKFSWSKCLRRNWLFALMIGSAILYCAFTSTGYRELSAGCLALLMITIACSAVMPSKSK